MKEKKARVEDALHATRAAVEEGVVAGAGVAYLRTQKALDSIKLEGDEAVGAEIVRRALEFPTRQLANNAGQEVALIVQEVKTHFLFSSLRKQLVKSILNSFQISGIWLQAHFEIVEDRLLVGFGCGDFLELHSAHRDLVAPDRR